jgi:hypothetical protein
VTPQDTQRGLRVTVPGSPGYPPVFYKQGSQYGEALRAFLVAQNYTAGYHWDYSQEKETVTEKKQWKPPAQETVTMKSAEQGKGTAAKSTLFSLLSFLLPNFVLDSMR